MVTLALYLWMATVLLIVVDKQKDSLNLLHIDEKTEP